MLRELFHDAKGLIGPEGEARLRHALDVLTARQDELTEAEREEVRDLAECLRSGEGPHGAVASDAELTLEIDDDQQRVWLSIQPPIGDGRRVTEADVRSQLAELGVKLEPDAAAIAAAVADAEDDQAVETIVIVRGREPRPGKPGAVERFARRLGADELAGVTDDDVADAPNDPLLCRAGDRVATIHPPAPGERGVDVTGEALPPPDPPAVELKAGGNTERRGDGVYALVDGAVRFKPDSVCVKKALILATELNAHSEPVDFDGDVIVRAAVRRGGSIRATGDVTVEGPVEGATLEAGGDVALLRGIVGQHRGLVRAGGDVRARFVESAHVIAGGDIVLEVGTMHASLTAGGSVLAERDKGQLIGGTIIAHRAIKARDLGGTGARSTVLIVGTPPKVLGRFAKLEYHAARWEARRLDAEALIRKIERAVGNPEKLVGEQRRRYTLLRQLALSCKVTARQVRAKLAEQIEQEPTRRGTVIASHRVLPNVTLRFGSRKHEPKPRNGRVRFEWDAERNRVRRFSNFDG